MPFTFDHLHLDSASRSLIQQACQGAESVALAPLDKGLSGSAVWVAKWMLKSRNWTKLHVFKIGDHAKLQREYLAVRDIASVIERGLPNFEIYPGVKDGIAPGEAKALLRQEFQGDPTGEPTSLRNFVVDARSEEKVRDIIRALFEDRLRDWHCTSSKHTEDLQLGQALDWWVSRMNIGDAIESIGRAPLSRSVAKLGLRLEDLDERIELILEREYSLPFGPVHGDLHAQNVLVDSTGGLHLIDYAWAALRWRAIDFLMMECSLKFFVAPGYLKLEDLLTMEGLLENSWDTDSDDALRPLLDCLSGLEILKIAVGVHAARRCALSLKAVQNVEQYRSGLLLLTAALTSMPRTMNQAFILHSVAHHLKEGSV